MHLGLWGLNGFFQGMGWPPCGRSMGHWFSERERGLTFSIWNTAHNVGGGVAGVIAGGAIHYLGGWQYAFYLPGVLATIGAFYILFRLCDTPQSVGLPPIEEYRQDYPNGARPGLDAERELTTRELLVDMVFTNKYIWILAAANFFAYVTRYSMLDWGPKYLREIKGATELGGGFSTMALEFGGIPSTILLGWVSDLLKGRRGMVAVLCLAPTMLAFTVIMLTPAGHLWLDMTMLTMIGFLIYPVISMGAKTHSGSKANLLGRDPQPDLMDLFSNERQVTRQTPPAFLAHAKDDTLVSPDNSRDFHAALQARQVASEYLELPSGGHGLNGYQGPMWDAWQTQSLVWLAAQKITEPAGGAHRPSSAGGQK